MSNDYGQCYQCESKEHKLLYPVCRGEDPLHKRNFLCLDCRKIQLKKRKCLSRRDKCSSTEICSRCDEEYAPCRGVFVWRKNYQQIRNDPEEPGGEIILVCSTCARHPGVVKEWWCKPDYLLDHGQARCVKCNKINLRREKIWGRCPHCKI